MLQFDVVTLFPGMFDAVTGSGITGRARERRVYEFVAWNPRDFAANSYRAVDDRPYGGGPGMVMMVGPFYRALKSLRALRGTKAAAGTRVVLLAAKGKRFTHADAVRLSSYKRVVLLCGRYEGVDERVAEHLVDEEISIGDYVLTGGELGAMVLIDAISRHVPGVLGDAESLAQESHAEEGVTEYPQYTRPDSFVPKKGETWDVPEALLSGHHAQIEKWRAEKKRKQ